MTPRARNIIGLALVLVVVNIGYAFVQSPDPVVRMVGSNVVIEAPPNGPPLYVDATLANTATLADLTFTGRSRVSFRGDLLRSVNVHTATLIVQCPGPKCNVCGPTMNCVNPVPPPPQIFLNGTRLTGLLTR
jgi:hypothetical protein